MNKYFLTVRAPCSPCGGTGTVETKLPGFNVKCGYCDGLGYREGVAPLSEALKPILVRLEALEVCARQLGTLALMNEPEGTER